jgi:type II secretory pathway predicted ATPase ExeA
MYLDFYKLKELPFRLAPQPRFMYWSAGHAAAFACLRSTQTRQNGCAALIAGPGAGKTTLLEWLAQKESSRAVVRMHFPPRSQAELTEILLAHIEPEAPRGSLLVICDNAHLLGEQMLAAIVLKTMLPPQQAHAARVVLAGEPALGETLAAPTFAALGTAWGERFQLPALTAPEVAAYIAHRLEVAGAQGAPIFPADVCAEIHRETKGRPRLVNALCDAAMVLACERELREVRSAEIRRGLEELGRLAGARPGDDSEPPDLHAPVLESSALPPPFPLARVRLLRQGQLVVERTLARGKLSVGRDGDNDLQIEGKFVSRHHCHILTTERISIIEDVRSTNGLYVNERRVRNHRLHDGDVVQVGDHYLEYVELRDAQTRESDLA